MLIVVANTAISIIQEIKAKKTIDKLTLTNSNFTNNKASNGGAIYVASADSKLINDIFNYYLYRKFLHK
mgnify:CR=1 FL=1